MDIIILNHQQVIETVEETGVKDSKDDEVVRNVIVEETSIVESGDNDLIIDETAEPTYCRICKEVCEEMETAEDVSYHIMNNHEIDEVITEYGQDWIQERIYSIRRGSPFEKL